MHGPMEAMDFCDRITSLIERQSKWSQATFGSDADRSPVGPLLHLAEEAKEAAEAPTDITEYADCFLLVLESIRRGGFTIMDLMTAAEEKQAVNMARKWEKPADELSPIHHEEDPTGQLGPGFCILEHIQLPPETQDGAKHTIRDLLQDIITEVDCACHEDKDTCWHCRAKGELNAIIGVIAADDPVLIDFVAPPAQCTTPGNFVRVV